MLHDFYVDTAFCHVGRQDSFPMYITFQTNKVNEIKQNLQKNKKIKLMQLDSYTDPIQTLIYICLYYICVKLPSKCTLLTSISCYHGIMMNVTHLDACKHGGASFFFFPHRVCVWLTVAFSGSYSAFFNRLLMKRANLNYKFIPTQISSFQKVMNYVKFDITKTKQVSILLISFQDPDLTPSPRTTPSLLNATTLWIISLAQESRANDYVGNGILS